MSSEAFIDAAWRGEPEPMAQLVTITSDADPTPIRVTDWPGGIVSNGEVYVHYPFRLTWAGATRETPFGQGRLTIANVDRRIEAACDAAVEPPTIDLAAVIVSAPDTPEAVIQGARLIGVEGDEIQATGVIRPRDFDSEPACAVSATPATTPAQF